jgi:homoserine O-acetyltransferase
VVDPTRSRARPERYFIIIPNMFGNGLPSSPSNVGPPHDRGRFPGVTVADNVRMQRRLLTERLGIIDRAVKELLTR